MKNKFIILSILFSLIVIFSKCKEDEEAAGTDKQLLDMAVEATGFTWYQFSDSLLPKSTGTPFSSGHPQPFLRTRYNDIAAMQLDSTGRILAGAQFADGSLVVKELIESNSTVSRYAILYKQTGHADSDANGWVWGYVNADGTVAASASQKGSACISCHSQTGNIDYMLMNIYFP